MWIFYTNKKKKVEIKQPQRAVQKEKNRGWMLKAKWFFSGVSLTGFFFDSRINYEIVFFFINLTKRLQKFLFVLTTLLQKCTIKYENALRACESRVDVTTNFFFFLKAHKGEKLYGSHWRRLLLFCFIYWP